LRGVLRGDEIGHGKAHSPERLRLYRDGLRRRAVFSGNLADGYRLLFDSKYRFAGHTIQNVQIDDLAGLREEWNFPTLDCDVEQYGSRRKIEVPLVVMDCLEIPFQLS